MYNSGVTRARVVVRRLKVLIVVTVECHLNKGIGRSKRGLIASTSNRSFGTRNRRRRRHRRRHGSSCIGSRTRIITRVTTTGATMTPALGSPTRGEFTTRSRSFTRGLFLRS
jgi:hypothetical protein